MESKNDENILSNNDLPITNSIEPIGKEKKKNVSATRSPRAATVKKTIENPVEKTAAISAIIKPEVVKPITVSKAKAILKTTPVKKSVEDIIPEEKEKQTPPSDLIVSVPKEEKKLLINTEKPSKISSKEKDKLKKKLNKKEKSKKREKAIKAIIKKLEKEKKAKLKEKAKKKEKAEKEKAKAKAKKAEKKKTKKSKAKKKK